MPRSELRGRTRDRSASPGGVSKGTKDLGSTKDSNKDSGDRDTKDTKNTTNTTNTNALNDSDSEEAMMKMLGITSFGTTKNKKVVGADVSGVAPKKATSEFRQYMNRPKGFNRPLSPPRTKRIRSTSPQV